MSDHYYSNKPEAAHDRQTLETELRGYKLKLTSDAGVFSKNGVDYGSRGLIGAMDLQGAKSVLDVGCGYGPIGIVAAKLLPDAVVTMIDINERAVELARHNAIQNQVSANTVIKQSDRLEAVREDRFDVILTNPPIRAGKDVVHAIFEEAYEQLNEGGTLWIVIQKKQGAPSAKAKLESMFSVVEEVTKDKGYRIFRAKK
ncbi:16S rRNA methyltransferase [Paenibacillus sp. FSL H7-0326]|uniref:class I SAM-dependent methyltransferase n=1 Tax=Paenibacillus sp. FSL H7-0326 TaxID=1921144 RepID=UPI00096DE42F|nr:class I SAM-dependent methyltransferase [Paenibacillus sp. FSL H7-0326]OMC63000.1 16S rRNA methyltransferase [Paenibacillus sp. FSL H7-0326]